MRPWTRIEKINGFREKANVESHDLSFFPSWGAIGFPQSQSWDHQVFHHILRDQTLTGMVPTNKYEENMGVQMCSSSSNAETKALFKLMDALFMAFASLLTLTFRDCVF